MNCLFCQIELDTLTKNYCNASCYKKHYRILNAEKIKRQKQDYHQQYKKTIVYRVNQWRKKNPDKVAEYNCGYKKRNSGKEKTPLEKIKHNVRCRVHDVLNGRSKPASVSASLGCSWKELKLHLESAFHHHPETGEAMTWQNLGKASEDNPYVWNIDHIKSLASFGEKLLDKEGFKDACNYKNLQPLWHIEHVEKTKRDILALKERKTLYLLTGAPASGKSWVLKSLPAGMTALDSDVIAKSKLVEEVDKCTNIPVLSLTIGVSTFIKNNPQYNIKLIVIQEELETLHQRMKDRGGEITPTLEKRAKRMSGLSKLALFSGTSSEVAAFFQNDL